jgi:hypothetical protein
MNMSFEFNNNIDSNNKSNFNEIWEKILLEKLIEDITIHILTKDENNYFSIDSWNLKNNSKNPKNIKYINNIIDTYIIPKLTLLNWKCKKAFRDTALFIYSTENPPSSYYDDGF